MKPDNNERGTKKPYSPPQLTVYGDLGKLTNAVFGASPTMDGSGYPANRTH